MIPNTELRIGNNVLYADKIAVVKSIQAHKVCISVNNRYIKCSYEDVFPIVLDEHVLKTYGWEWNNETKTFEKPKFPMGHIRFNSFSLGAGMLNYVLNSMTSYRNFYYLHQLQNIFFTLRNEELTETTTLENGSERTN